jgi:hypothetical protein
VTDGWVAWDEPLDGNSYSPPVADR